MPSLSVAILWTPEQLLWSIGNRVESTGWSGILPPSIYGLLGWDLRFVYNAVSNWWSCRSFFVGSCWCSEMQITDKICSTMFCLSLNFCVHGLVFWWFLRLLRAFRVSNSFFIGWCFPLIHMAWTSSTQIVYCQASSVILSATLVYQPVLISLCLLVPETSKDALN